MKRITIWDEAAQCNAEAIYTPRGGGGYPVTIYRRVDPRVFTGEVTKSGSASRTFWDAEIDGHCTGGGTLADGEVTDKTRNGAVTMALCRAVKAREALS